MSRNLFPNVLSVVLLVAVSLVAAGCARNIICFKTIDATTGAPLAGVSVRWRQDRHDIIRGLDSYGPTNLPPSREDGAVTVVELRPFWTSRFIYTCPGYSNVYGIYNRGALGLAERVSDPGEGRFKGQFILEDNVMAACLSNGCYVVPLPRSAKRGE